MNNHGFILAKFFISGFVGICTIFVTEVMSISKSIGTMVDEARPMLDKINYTKNIEYSNIDLPINTGARG